MTQDFNSFIDVPPSNSRSLFENKNSVDFIEKNLSRSVMLTLEDNYWRQNFWFCDYVGLNETYEIYQQAFLHGVQSYLKYNGRAFSEIESHVANDWYAASNRKTLPWIKAKYAVHSAYQRLLLEELEIDASIGNFFGLKQLEGDIM